MPAPLTQSEQNIRYIMSVTEQNWPMWWENGGENMSLIRTGKNLSDMTPRTGPAVIVGGGPSLQKYRHVDILARYRKRIPTIITTDRVPKTLSIHGCTPDCVATIDGPPSVPRY